MSKTTQVNKMNPVANDIAMGTLLNNLIAAVNNLTAAHDALLAKLDTDFTAQNLAVASSQLDEDYAASVPSGNSAITTIPS